jgi:hypothetical protein
MTTDKDRAYVSSGVNGLVAGAWDDYANISYLTDEKHRLPDWILRLISGQKRWQQSLGVMGFRGSITGGLTAYGEVKKDPKNVRNQWLFILACYEIGLKQVISEYENQRETDRVEESDQPS